MPSFSPRIVGVGGTTRPGSSSEKALAYALRVAESQGAQVELFGGERLILPLYAPENAERAADARALVAALRAADGVIFASPGYHGTISGMVKNAIDYIEDMAKDERVYLEGRSVGLIACAYGWQATGSTLAALRSVAHALRGWPTPLGVAINSITTGFDSAGVPTDPAAKTQLELLGKQVVDFASYRHAHANFPAIAPPV